MTRYLKIANAGQISRDSIELLGYSQKRGDKETIGEKGTGLKFSRIQAVRKKIDFFVCTNEFKNSLKPKDGHDERLVFEYEDWSGDTEIIDTSYTVNAGFSDWVDDWYILREVVQNARDENLMNLNLKNPMETTIKSIKIVRDMVQPEPGETVVYIELTHDLEQIFKEIEHYFCDESAFILDRKKDEKRMRVFMRGIFVGTLPALKGFYSDINVEDVMLTESRDIKHEWQVFEQFYSRLSAQDSKVIRAFLRYAAKNMDSVELGKYIDASNYVGQPVYNAFLAEFGEDIVIHNSNSVTEYRAALLKKKKLSMVCLGGTLYSFLGRKGVSTFNDLEFEVKKEYTVVDYDLEKMSREIDLCSEFFGPAQIKVFEKDDDSMVGFVKDGQIFINKIIVGSELLMPTLVEEFIHLKTGHSDYTRSFQDYSTRIIGELLQKNES